MKRTTLTLVAACAAIVFAFLAYLDVALLLPPEILLSDELWLGLVAVAIPVILIIWVRQASKLLKVLMIGGFLLSVLMPVFTWAEKLTGWNYPTSHGHVYRGVAFASSQVGLGKGLLFTGLLGISTAAVIALIGILLMACVKSQSKPPKEVYE